MEDVARQAGVSKSTVSLALNDKPGVSQEIKDVVLRIAEELGYALPKRHIPRASLPQQKDFAPPKQKNFIVVHHVGHEPFDEIYSLFLDYLQGIQIFAQEANINITAIGGYRKGDLDRLEARILRDPTMQVDGLLLMGKGIRQDSQLLHRALELQIPVVVLSRNWPDLPVSTVSQDHCQHAKTALDHLVQLGHRQIAYVAQDGDQEYDWYAPRLRCYHDKMKELGQEVNDDLIVLGKDGADAARKLLARQPGTTAIFAIHDQRANEAMQGAMDMGLEIPRDISVIGLDDSEEPPVGFPRLTTVGFPHVDVGYLGAELLLRQIENTSLCYSKLTVRSTLIERGSCAKPRIPDGVSSPEANSGNPLSIWNLNLALKKPSF
jgi:LacI family transcriptional regulator